MTAQSLPDLPEVGSLPYDANATVRPSLATHRRVSYARASEMFTYAPEEGRLYRNKTTKTKLAGTEAGWVGRKGYRMVSIDSEAYFTHRIVWLLENKEHPPDQIDHVNRIKSDNRITNLRAVTDGQNKHNRGVQPNSMSGEPGVSQARRTGKWRAYIKLRGRQINLGYFVKFSDAVSVRKSAKVCVDMALFGGTVGSEGNPVTKPCDAAKYITVVFRVPNPDTPDYAELSKVLSHAWVRQLAAGDHLNLNLKPENDQGRRR